MLITLSTKLAKCRKGKIEIGIDGRSKTDGKSEFNNIAIWVANKC